MAWFQRKTPHQKTVGAVSARQGFLDRPVLVVLVASLVLIVLGYAAVVIGLW